MTPPFITLFAPLAPAAWLRRGRDDLPWPLGDPRVRQYQWGRHGLWHGLPLIGHEPGDEILVPAYHHGAEIEAIVRRGAVPVYYAGDERLQPEEAELDLLITDRTRALYLTHVLGVPQDVPRWRRFCDERGLRLIEDVAQAWTATWDGRPLGSWGDLSIFSTWKGFGLPDGGLLVVADETADPPQPAARDHGVAQAAKLSAQWLAGRWGVVAGSRARRLPDQLFDAEAAFSLGDPDRAPSAVTNRLLERVARHHRHATGIRQRHHARFVERLGNRVPAPFDALPAGAVPFAVPVETHDKRGLMRHLARNGIRGTDFWSVPHPTLRPDARFADIDRRRRSTVLLPTHQELRERDVERIADHVLAFEASEGEPERERIVAGDAAPPFALQSAEGEVVRLDEFAGAPVVVYFYPEADTPGCTAQACSLRDQYRTFADLGVRVVGISPDAPDRLAEFARRYGLPFTLLSDPQGETARRYGVWVRRPGLLPRYENERTTFVIDASGTVSRVLRAVDPAAHDDVLLRELSAPAA